jgi:CSLREA domain-containing protein
MKVWTRAGAVASGVALMGLGLAACQVPTHYVVNSNADVDDVNPGDGLCQTPTGDCTLRAALDEANAALGAPVTIELAGGTTYQASDRTLGVGGNATIEGHGATLVPGSAGFFWVSSSGHLVLSDAVINGGASENGAGMAVQTWGSTSLNGVEITQVGSNAGDTSAIWQADGFLALLHTNVDGNYPGNGATVLVQGGTTVIADSAVTRNTQPLYGNGTDLREEGGDVTILDSTVGEQTGTMYLVICNPNCAPQPLPFSGDAIVQSGGTMTLERSTVSNSDRGIANGGDVTMSGTAVVGNNTSCTSAVVSSGYNADDRGTCLSTPQPTDHIGGSALLVNSTAGTPIFDIPAAGSSMVDAIPQDTSGLCDATTPTDQRGATRPTGAGCDIGAIERQPGDPAS